MKLKDLLNTMGQQQQALFNPLQQRNIYDAKRFAYSIGWRRPPRGKVYPYNSTKRGWVRPI